MTSFEKPSASKKYAWLRKAALALLLVPIIVLGIKDFWPGTATVPPSSLISSEEVARRERLRQRMEETRPRPVDWHAMVDGKRIRPGQKYDVPIEFEWAGYKWRIPAIDMAGEFNSEGGEVQGMVFHFQWNGERLISPLREEAQTRDRGIVVTLMPHLRHAGLGSFVERDMSKLGEPVEVPGLPYNVYPWNGHPRLPPIWQALSTNDRLGIPIEFTCDLLMESILAGQATLAMNFEHPGETCEGVLFLRPSFGIRYRFHMSWLKESVQLTEAVMALFDSWIVEE